MGKGTHFDVASNRVVFYGDHMDSIRHLARLMSLNVVEEG
jgi:hypothetical protein